MTTVLEKLADEIMRDIERNTFMTIPQRQYGRDLIVKRLQPHIVQQAQFHFTDSDKKTNEAQCEKILALLKERRSAGATNVELAELALKYTSRISQLRQAPHNYRIQCVREEGRVTRYTLYATDW